MLSMVANRRADPQLGDEHILIKPDFPEDLGFASWERHNEVFLHAYRGVVSSIRARMTEDDPKMLALIGRA